MGVGSLIVKLMRKINFFTTACHILPVNSFLIKLNFLCFLKNMQEKMMCKVLTMVGMYLSFKGE